MANNVEIIDITSPVQTVVYDSIRRSNFGSFPKAQVWIQDGAAYILSDMQPQADDVPASFTQLVFDFGYAVTGFIVLK